MNRLGIFGGSFNPVHMGHCAVAEHFVRQVGLDTCMFVPTYISPFKKDEPGVAEHYHRLSMLRSVCRTNAHFAVSDVELRRRDVSYTVTTVRHFRDRYPKAELFLLIGQDLVPRFDEWRDWEEIVRMATVCVARRSPDVVPGVGDIPGFSDAARADAAMLQRMSATGHTPLELFPPRIDVSSSMVRTMCSRGESVRYIVPETVRRLIRRHGLYKGSASGVGKGHGKDTGTIPDGADTAGRQT